MSDFFGRLELELRAAAERPPRRGPDWRSAARGGTVAVVAAAVVALALVPVLVILGGGGDDSGRGERRAADAPRLQEAFPPVGTVIPAGRGALPGESDHIVVATGTEPISGPWQMEHYTSGRLADPQTDETYQPTGLPCLSIKLLRPPAGASVSGGAVSGGCGEFPRTPGFGRAQTLAGGDIREILVYGRAPERATAVELKVDSGSKARVEPFEGPPSVPGDFYLIAIPADLEGRVNWIDEDGKEGSQGIALLPP